MCGIWCELLPAVGNEAQRQHAHYPPGNGIKRRGPHSFGEIGFQAGTFHRLCMASGVLHIRGKEICHQPHFDESSNALLWNGEVFGGALLQRINSEEVLNAYAADMVLVFFLPSHYEFAPQTPFQADTAAILLALAEERDPIGVMRVLTEEIKGPWAVVYWSEMQKTLYVGRDPLARRSLLICKGKDGTSLTIASAVCPPALHNSNKGSYGWEELPADGIYHWQASSRSGMCLNLEPWSPKVLSLGHVAFRRRTELQSLQSDTSSRATTVLKAAAEELFEVLTNAVIRRASPSFTPIPDDGSSARIAVLFSGGVDSSVIAALLASSGAVCKGEAVDLLNVSFGKGGASPDRSTSISTVVELCDLYPHVDWRLIAIDVDYSDAINYSNISYAAAPATTVMDFNIAAAIWFAARGYGVLVEQHKSSPGTLLQTEEKVSNVIYKSKARVVLAGMGADEQLAGYARHRSAWKRGGGDQLAKEIEKDLGRLWKRNLGRDDRCVADHGKEARFPFLDEDVVACIANHPMTVLADLSDAAPPGVGDKLVLRMVAQRLGLHFSATLPKRAIQFGTRLAHASKTAAGGRKESGTNVSLHLNSICH